MPRYQRRAHCGIFVTLNVFFNRATVPDGFSALMSPNHNNNNRGVVMSIAALILVLLLPFAVGLILNRRDVERKMRRFG